MAPAAEVAHADDGFVAIDFVQPLGHFIHWYVQGAGHGRRLGHDQARAADGPRHLLSRAVGVDDLLVRKKSLVDHLHVTVIVPPHRLDLQFALTVKYDHG